MKKGTIIYLGAFLLPDRSAAAHRVINNAKAFRDLEYNVVFVDISDTAISNTPIKDTKKNIFGFEYFSMPLPKNKLDWLKFFFSIKQQLDIINLYEDTTYLVCYNYPAIATFRLKLVCKIKNIKVIADCTEWHHRTNQGILYSFIRNLDTGLRMRFVNKKLDGIIVISSYLKDYYKNVHNTVFIPPLVDITDEKWKKENTKQSEKESIQLIYSGSPGNNKDRLDLIVKYVFNTTANVKLNIIGLTKVEFLKIFPHYPKNLFNDNIVFMGRLSHNDAVALLKKSDFSIFLRDKTRISNAGFSTKFVESISCQIPVITNNTGDISSFISNGINGYILSNGQTEFDEIMNIPIEKVEQIKQNVNYKQFSYSSYISYLDEFLQKVQLK